VCCLHMGSADSNLRDVKLWPFLFSGKCSCCPQKILLPVATADDKIPAARPRVLSRRAVPSSRSSFKIDEFLIFFHSNSNLESA
jgi:hypothetical protein